VSQANRGLANYQALTIGMPWFFLLYKDVQLEVLEGCAIVSALNKEGANTQARQCGAYPPLPWDDRIEVYIFELGISPSMRGKTVPLNYRNVMWSTEQAIEMQWINRTGTVFHDEPITGKE
jgi:hypothetical protein